MQTITLQPGESVTITTAAVTPVPPAQKLYFTYFGGMEDEIFAYENMVFATTWFSPNTSWIIDAMTRAKAAGVAAAMVAMDYLLYRAVGNNRVYLGDAIATANCKTFFDALKAAGLLTMLKALYPIDEPEIVNIPSSQVVACNTNLRKVMALYPELADSKLAVTYSGRQDFRGIETYDWIGVDDYDKGVGILFTIYPNLLNNMTAEQRLILVPGGADPWRTPIEGFYDYAKTSTRVSLIMSFIWISPWGGTGNAGISTNGMAPSYNAVATQIRNS